jgi:hypothetical protein
MENEIDIRKITSLLAEPERFKILAAVALKANTLEKIAVMTGLENAVIMKALVKLEAAELVVKKPAGYAFNPGPLQALNREIGKNAPPKPKLSTLEKFLRGDKLVTFPKAKGDQMVVLDHIANLFEFNRRYSEKEVNEKLKSVDPDFASLRRRLIDNVFFAREHVTEEDGHTVIYYWRVEQI